MTHHKPIHSGLQNHLKFLLWGYIHHRLDTSCLTRSLYTRGSN